MNNAVAGLAGTLSTSILDSDDPQTVRDGAPSYLLLVDAMVRDNEGSIDMLESAARLYGAYGAAFVQEPTRAQKFAAKAFGYANRALCQYDQGACGLSAGGDEQLQNYLGRSERADLSHVYVLAVAWAGQIQANSEDWNAVADLNKVRSLMEWVVRVDEAHDHGGAHLYLGVLDTLLPPQLGGQAERGRTHFEKAIALSNGQHLMTKVVFARQYARLIYDRELHDQLLNDVVAADPHAPGLTLINVVAQEQARQLLANADSYF